MIPLAMVALIQALVVTLQNTGKHPNTHIQILESNKWQAARYGLEGTFIDPLNLKQLSLRKAIESLCELVEPKMVSLESAKYIKVLEEILSKGDGSTIQREMYNSSGSFEHMIKSLKEQFYQ